MTPCTAKSITAALPAEPASARLIAARSEPAPELLRFVTTIDCEDAGVTVAAPVTRAAAGPAATTTPVVVQTAMQAAPAIRSRILDSNGRAPSNPLRGSLGRAVRANIVSPASNSWRNSLMCRGYLAGDARPEFAVGKS